MRADRRQRRPLHPSAHATASLAWANATTAVALTCRPVAQVMGPRRRTMRSLRHRGGHLSGWSPQPRGALDVGHNVTVRVAGHASSPTGGVSARGSRRSPARRARPRTAPRAIRL
jgi:hypothetical protein